MTYSTFYRVLVAAVFTSLGMSRIAIAQNRPNVILIMTDDQGYGDLGVTGNPVIQTPHLDSLAAQSASMATFYVSPVCSPTRACLMTGRYNYRTRCIDTYIGRSMMDTEEVTVAELLRDAGYATGIFGKWHLGDAYPMRAMDQGFEMSVVHRGGGIGQPSDPPGAERKYTDPTLFRNGQAEQMTGYCTDIYFDEAMQWMGEQADNERPFFAYIATNAPHGPFHDVPKDLYEKYRAMDLSNAKMPHEQGTHPLPSEINHDRRARIFAMITNVDDNVGRLLAHLDEHELADSTMVIFMVDNGPNEPRYVAGMRGSKSSVYEGGIRSPLFVRWPDRLKAGTRVENEVGAHIDVMPTILDACDVDPPLDLQIDGGSLLGLLEGEPASWRDRHIFIQTHRGNMPVRYHHMMVRNNRWKLVHASGFGRESFEGEPQFELYDMVNDPLELTDVASDHPETVRLLRGAYDVWFDDVSSTRANNYAPPRIHLGSPRAAQVTLTRQDWRHQEGRPWGRNSVGEWLVTIERDGRYEITVRWSPSESPVCVRLSVAGLDARQTVEAGASECVFEVNLSAGDSGLAAHIEEGEAVRGAHQVDVVWRR